VSGTLAVEGLHVRYGRVRALNGVDLEVEPGRVLAVLGRNGAGKSSLLGTMAGSVRPHRGRVLWEGADITSIPADRRARRGIALVPEGRRIFENVTVLENLVLGGFTRSAAERAAALERVLGVFPVLSERGAAKGGQLSGGQQQMLSIGRALMGEPRILLLDEPSLGLAPRAVEDVYAQLRRLKAEGIGMILVEQQVGRALDLADEAVVLNLGEVALRAAPDQLRDDPRLVGAYLGTTNRRT
jgi:branched-chain amino acid transport system ATP-binding protein